MSFPWFYAKVRRHSSISVEYLDEEGNKKEWKNINQAISGNVSAEPDTMRMALTLSSFQTELLQHEIDHLDGTEE